MRKNLTCLHDECFKIWYFYRHYLQKVVFSTINSGALKKAEAHNELYSAKNSQKKLMKYFTNALKGTEQSFKCTN